MLIRIKKRKVKMCHFIILLLKNLSDALYEQFLWKLCCSQGRHGHFLAGKAATSAAVCFIFCKIQAKPRPWGPCQPWRPWVFSLLNRYFRRNRSQANEKRKKKKDTKKRDFFPFFFMSEVKTPI